MSCCNRKASGSGWGDDAGASTPQCENCPPCAELEPEKVQMRRVLRLHNGVAMIVGVVIGSGIFVSPAGVLQETGSIGGALLMWVVCGVTATLGAMCYAELGTMINRSGGDYAYVGEAFGPLLAFLYLWVALLVIWPCATAIIAITFANYVLQPFYVDCDTSAQAVRLIAALAISLLTLVNIWNVDWTKNLQVVFTVAKILALVIVISAGCVQLMRKANTPLVSDFWSNSSTRPGSYALAFYSGIFSYSGWNCLNFVTEELKNPYKNLPRAIWISLPLTMAVYVLANIAYFVVLSPEEMLSSVAVAVTFSQRMLGPMAWLMPVFVAFSTFGSLNGCIFVTSRLFFVGARNHHLPPCLALIHYKFRTPVPALLISSMVSLAYLLTDQGIYILITYMSFVEQTFVAISTLGLLWLRYTQPHRRRPIKVCFIIPVVFLLIMSFVIVFPFTVDATECLIGLLILLAGVPAFWLLMLLKRKDHLRKLNGTVTRLLQKLLLCCQEDLSQ